MDSSQSSNYMKFDNQFDLNYIPLNLFVANFKSIFGRELLFIFSYKYFIPFYPSFEEIWLAFIWLILKVYVVAEKYRSLKFKGTN